MIKNMAILGTIFLLFNDVSDQSEACETSRTDNSIATSSYPSNDNAKSQKDRSYFYGENAVMTTPERDFRRDVLESMQSIVSDNDSVALRLDNQAMQKHMIDIYLRPLLERNPEHIGKRMDIRPDGNALTFCVTAVNFSIQKALDLRGFSAFAQQSHFISCNSKEFFTSNNTFLKNVKDLSAPSKSNHYEMPIRAGDIGFTPLGIHTYMINKAVYINESTSCSEKRELVRDCEYIDPNELKSGMVFVERIEAVEFAYKSVEIFDSYEEFVNAYGNQGWGGHHFVDLGDMVSNTVADFSFIHEPNKHEATYSIE